MLINNVVVDSSGRTEKPLFDIRLVILAGTAYENDFRNFANRMNNLMQPSGLSINAVKSLFPSLG